MNIWFLWLIIVFLPKLEGVIGFLLFVTCFASGIWTIMYLVSNGCWVIEEDKEAKKFMEYVKTLKWVPLSLIFVFPLYLVTPDKTDIAYLIGGYFTTNIEDIEKLPPNLVKSANKFLEDYNMEEE